MVNPSTFDTLTASLRHTGHRTRLAVVCGDDPSTRAAVLRAVCEGFAEATFFGGEPLPSDLLSAIAGLGSPVGGYLRHVPCEGHAESAARAVESVRNGQADVLVKGLLHTATLLRAVLDKECGLLTPGAVLTHIAAAEVPTYDKLLFFSDAAVIPYPTPVQRAAQLGYMSDLLHRLGMDEPRIALIHCAETTSDKFPATLTYPDLVARAARGEWGRVRVDGPLDLRTACDPVALRTKGIDSPLEGRADGLILPDIEAGNVLYKALSFFASATVAGALFGASVPVVLPSRGDDEQAKYCSLALAAASCHGLREQ